MAAADEAGVSFWLPGQYGSYAAAPGKPGLSFEAAFYHATASANASATFARGGGIEVGIKSPSDFLMLTPTYSFDSKLFGAQPALGITALVGRNMTSASATLTGLGGGMLSGSQSDQVFGLGDLSPTASLKWNRDVHNFMVYTTAGIPVGAYDPTRLAALGLGHWAVDGGAGYTYLNEKAGIEFSAVVGLTYNFVNPYTQYRSGNDAHVDWAFSPYVSEKMHFGAVGYFYNQLSGDSGAGAALGEFKSRVAAIGPQIGFFLPLGDREGYLNLRAYYEFAAQNRPEGWNAYLAFSVESPEQKSPIRAQKR
ncbi:MAG TPA: transporter [Pseudolabrys sp.]|nr:transporter [Pseudolabrys sp.]